MGRMKELWLQQMEEADEPDPSEGDCSELCSTCMFFHVPTQACVKEETDV